MEGRPPLCGRPPEILQPVPASSSVAGMNQAHLVSRLYTAVTSHTHVGIAPEVNGSKKTAALVNLPYDGRPLHPGGSSTPILSVRSFFCVQHIGSLISQRHQVFTAYGPFVELSASPSS